MSKALEILELEAEHMKKEVPSFSIGDTVAVTVRIIEGGKERAQTFTGTVIAKRGTGLSETFTVYRIAYGSNMDRIFMLHSPLISKIEVIRSGKVRRAKLNYIRGRSGKAAKIQESYRKETKKAPAVALEKPEVNSTEETPPES